jgi:hypothetical protein
MTSADIAMYRAKQKGAPPRPVGPVGPSGAPDTRPG